MHRQELTLQNEVIAACRASLAHGAERRRDVDTPEKWQAWRREILGVIRSAFPPVVFERGAEVAARVVSSYELDRFRIENVLFESLPGWEVNGTVYLPKEPGTYPGVLCPTGHSTKTRQDYQQSTQVFARNGYIAISFDPPGCAGELARLNDHFTNGLIGYLTDFWSQSHFVVDALRCLDYLQTRPDVDAAAGLSATGVSGGGKTSIYAALLDDRVAFLSPVCCLNEHESIHLTDLYTSCPEQFGPGYIAAGIDYVDYIAAVAPLPCLIVAGKKDEVFDHQSTLRIHKEAQRIYDVAGHADLCGLFIDGDSGHGYTVAMANEVVGWMNRVIKKTDEPPLPLADDDIVILDTERLLCHPHNEANMFTINRDEAARLQKERSPEQARERMRTAAADLLSVSAEAEPLRVTARSEPRTSWHALVEEVDIQPAEDVHLPGLMLTHVEDKSPRPGLLWLDEQGKWAALRQSGFMSRPLRMIEDDCRPNQPRILSVDLSGFGRLTPEPTAYDLAGWNDIERILTYLSIGNAQPIMGLRVRDALCSLHYLRERPEVDSDRIMVAGRGIGAVVALHVALLADGVRRAICLDMLSHYGALTEKFPFTWPQSIIIPKILKHYDLPEIAAILPDCTVSVINPVDAQRNPISQEAAGTLYDKAIVRCGVDGGLAVVEAIEEEWR